MRAHIVLAHPEPLSYNGHLTEIAHKTLHCQGWDVTISDLYSMGFDPCERPEHFSDRGDPSRFDVQAEQYRASGNGSIPRQVADEIARLEVADLLILQYPMWWHMPPAMLKGWLDRVFIYGDVYASKKRFEAGRFLGKRAMLSVTVATSADTYAHNGRSGDIDLMLWPVNFSLAYVGYTVLTPFVAYGVEAGLRYSDPATVRKRLEKVSEDYETWLRRLDTVPALGFNRMEEWGPDGRIKPGSPVYSPFVRHRRNLDLV